MLSRLRAVGGSAVTMSDTAVVGGIDRAWSSPLDEFRRAAGSLKPFFMVGMWLSVRTGWRNPVLLNFLPS